MYKFYFFNFIILSFLSISIYSQNYHSQKIKVSQFNNKTAGVILYEQMNNFGSNSITSQNFDTTYNVYDNQIADDFIIPVGDDSWTIESIDVSGVYFNGTGPANSVNIWFYNDSLGFPGSIQASRSDIVPSAGISTGSFVINLISPITLPPGVYWLSVQTNMDSAVGQWGWTEQLQSSTESVWQNPGGGWINSCTSWGYRLTNCNVGSTPYYDMSFRLNGYKGDPCPVEPASNPNPPDLQANIQVSGINLGWNNGAATDFVEVWFGPDNRLLKLYDGPIISSWPLGTLNYATQYGWYIVSKDDTCEVQSPLWTFTTVQDTNIIIDTMDVYPQNLNNWTGTCNTSSKTQISLVNSYNTELGWMAFDISAIPNNVTINSVIFNGYLYENSWPYWSITPMGNVNPITDPASTIFNQVSTHSGQGIAYSYNLESGNLNNNWITRTLGSTVTVDLQNALSKNWFAIGIVDFDFSTNYFVKFHGWAEANKPYLRVIYSFLGVTTFQLSLDIENGWNMISIPGLLPGAQNVDSWWSHRDPAANVWRYVPGTGYFSTTNLIPGKGYWMKNLGSNTYNTGDEWPAEGIRIVRHDPINASNGWNIFGAYEEIVPAAGLTTIPPGLINGPVYGYSGGYFTTSNLEPGNGYWIKLSGDGQIIIPDASLKSNNEIIEWFKDDWGRITFIDAAGKNFTLYSVNGDVDLNLYELPPLPPAGSFDIRFGSGRIAEDINNSMQTIDMAGVTYPLTVRAEGMGIRLTDESGKNLNITLKDGEDLVIDNPILNKLLVSVEFLPTVYSLEQNYPNPFNPSTVIGFSLPEEVANANLSIYNSLGEKVAELVNTSLQAGKYQYNWNASGVATGMYIYELRADNFVSVKKMLLIK
ncbi:MAG: T9SS type A sorting domain-containing protein [Ignavibacteriota bacterium]|nr:MAG: T9SS C-terminal target domain-containing protein [Chlorobiota bacterium]MBL1123912.1 T9SS C-terminal target domain-containing protein [Ignavibacteriota bacterium]MCC7094921.1 T9SS type A sorting domain-containing protein [Ignavibacteriaceae bacterium]MCE7857883.1 T9SS C-terminal target domain-containing protein [Ignavibacteria bacterium CHB3]QKJ97632.1 MAG: T9SS type A sorting domain-containing protein [Ignavibacteriota bacterium]